MSSSYSKSDYIEFIKLQLTGGVLDLELTDETIGQYVDFALRELNRYIDQPIRITVPFSKVIDLKDFNYSAITNVYRSTPLGGLNAAEQYDSSIDPMYAQQWAAFCGGSGYYNLNAYIMNFAAYSTLQQMRNTLSTDLSWIEDKASERLYINTSNIPTKVTIEYIPVYKRVEDITSDYWIDILQRLSLALTKIGLGRVRTRFTQSNALWTQDGETMLNEGNEELKELRETLRVNAQLSYVRD